MFVRTRAMILGSEESPHRSLLGLLGLQVILLSEVTEGGISICIILSTTIKYLEASMEKVDMVWHV